MELIGCPPVLDRYVLPRHIPCLDQPLPKCVYGSGRNIFGRPDAHKSDHRRPLLLRARRERPRSRCAAKNRYEVAAVHSIGASARASKVGGENVMMNSRRFI